MSSLIITTGTNLSIPILCALGRLIVSTALSGMYGIIPELYPPEVSISVCLLTEAKMVLITPFLAESESFGTGI